MRLRLAAIEATCRSELADGKKVPSQSLLGLAKSAGLSCNTIEDLRIEARKKLDAAMACPFA